MTPLRPINRDACEKWRFHWLQIFTTHGSALWRAACELWYALSRRHIRCASLKVLLHSKCSNEVFPGSGLEETSTLSHSGQTRFEGIHLLPRKHNNQGCLPLRSPCGMTRIIQALSLSQQHCVCFTGLSRAPFSKRYHSPKVSGLHGPTLCLPPRWCDIFQQIPIRGS